MILREESFSAMRINWENKPSNMRSLAEELGIGLDSLVFVDDSEKERALMRQALPEVLTLDMPRDPALYRETLEALPALQALTVTEEDRARTRQYIERRQREKLRVTAQSVEEYLGSLGIVVETARVSERTLARVHQLFQRTNQFNLTGRRYEPGALACRAGEADWRIYATHVSDRFGDHGLVAAALVHVTPDAWVIENLVMSCRVIGYGVENALLARLSMDAREAATRWLVGEFIPTAKNAPARDFYARNAFARDDGGSPERWRRDVMQHALAMPEWITVRSDNGA
jgi:FkbH-like protein